MTKVILPKCIKENKRWEQKSRNVRKRKNVVGWWGRGKQQRPLSYLNLKPAKCDTQKKMLFLY